MANRTPKYTKISSADVVSGGIYHIAESELNGAPNVRVRVAGKKRAWSGDGYDGETLVLFTVEGVYARFGTDTRQLEIGDFVALANRA